MATSYPWAQSLACWQRLAAERTATKDADDLQLAARAAHGDTEAFTNNMRRHNRMLYRAARSIL